MKFYAIQEIAPEDNPEAKMPYVISLDEEAFRLLVKIMRREDESLHLVILDQK